MQRRSSFWVVDCLAFFCLSEFVILYKLMKEFENDGWIYIWTIQLIERICEKKRGIQQTNSFSYFSLFFSINKQITQAL